MFVEIMDEAFLSLENLEYNLLKSFFINRSTKYFKIFRNKFDTPLQKLLTFKDEFNDIDIFLEKCEYMPRDIIKIFLPFQDPFYKNESLPITYFEKWIQYGASNFLTYLFTNEEYEETLFKRMFKATEALNQRTPLISLLDQGNALTRQRLEFI